MNNKELKQLVKLLDKGRKTWTAQQVGTVVAFILLGLMEQPLSPIHWTRREPAKALLWKRK